MKSTYNWSIHPQFQHPRPSVQPSFNPLQSLQNGLKTLYHNLVPYFAASDQPHAWSTRGLDGQQLWNAIDPTTGASIREVSAHELRIWLEERHNWH